MKTKNAQSLERRSKKLNTEYFKGMMKSGLTFIQAKSPEGKTGSPLQGIQSINYLLLTEKYMF